MIRQVFLYFLIIFFWHASFLHAMSSPPPRAYIPVRVLVVKNAEKVDLCIKGPYKIANLDTGEILEEGSNLRRPTLFAKDIASRGIKVLPGKRARVYINKRQFRGNIDIIKIENIKLIVINHIDIEEYLYGVLYHEVSHRWPIEVLKAQATVARTYALYQKMISKNEYYDLSSDIYSQVYGGRRSETWRTRKAVNLTSGRILTYNDKVFPSYYHATCGGYTSNVATLWNIDVPALHSKRCNFCKISPHYKWKKELSIIEIENRLKESGHNIQLLSIEILKRDKPGRILDMFLKGRNGDIKISGNKFRLAVGPNIIRSANFNVEIRGNVVIFQGKGWGHGIGMCQWGAYGMARQGWEVEEILEYYYPGADITRVE